MAGLNQNRDEGSVIGYKPDLRYVKQIQNTAEIKQLTSQTTIVDVIGMTATTYQFSKNMPSSVLETAAFVIETINNVMDGMAEYFENGKYSQYNQISMFMSAIYNNDTDFINAFVNYHIDKIDGSRVPELVQLLYDTKKRVEILAKDLKYLYYGNENIQDETAKQQDEAFCKHIKELEQSKHQEKVNYVAISYDGVMNRAISNGLFGINRQVYQIAEILQNDIGEPGKADTDFLKSLFSESNYGVKSRKSSYETKQTVEIMQNTLYNYYENRQKLMKMYDLMGDDGFNYLYNKAESVHAGMNDSIRDVVRCIAGNTEHLKQMQGFEQEKVYLSKIYDELNYIS